MQAKNQTSRAVTELATGIFVLNKYSDSWIEQHMKDPKKQKGRSIKKAREQVGYGDASADTVTNLQGDRERMDPEWKRCEVCFMAMNYLRGRIEHIDEYEA